MPEPDPLLEVSVIFWERGPRSGSGHAQILAAKLMLLLAATFLLVSPALKSDWAVYVLHRGLHCLEVPVNLLVWPRSSQQHVRVEALRSVPAPAPHDSLD